ncbi:MAG: ABC transporter permease [Lachnospiraceae bacterium]|nr:ABC transporter permease [Lachnospiraceae bacterium]
MKLKYVGKRILIIIPTFIGITILAYFLSAMAPGSPIDMILGTQNLGPDDVARLTKLYGLDQPVIIQYFNWFRLLLQGNLGLSYRTSEPVLSMILSRMGPTLLITLTSVVISVILSIPMGVAAAVKPYSAWDYIASGISFLAAAAPNFFVSLILVYIFGVRLGILPTSGMYTSASAKEFGDLVRHMILPVAVLAFQQIGNLIRQVRGSMLEILQEDYIRTAREKGLKEGRIVIRHGLRNALVPVVTTVGMNLPFIIGGAVVTEQIFSWPGIGSLMVQSINARDYPAIMGITVFIAVVVLIGNLIIDLIYGILDPRISYK